jgi:hypothetical protein
MEIVLLPVNPSEVRDMVHLKMFLSPVLRHILQTYYRLLYDAANCLTV